MPYFSCPVCRISVARVAAHLHQDPCCPRCQLRDGRVVEMVRSPGPRERFSRSVERLERITEAKARLKPL